MSLELNNVHVTSDAPFTIEAGGTGADNAADALDNLTVAASPIVQSDLTIDLASAAGVYVEVTGDGVTISDNFGVGAVGMLRVVKFVSTTNIRTDTGNIRLPGPTDHTFVAGDLLVLTYDANAKWVVLAFTQQGVDLGTSGFAREAGDAATAKQVLSFDSQRVGLQIPGNEDDGYTIDFADVGPESWQQALFPTNTTGSGTALLGANCPASVVTHPDTWIAVTLQDGSTAYIPAWK